MSVTWVRDPQAETLLKEKGVKFKVVAGIKLSHVLVDESLKNNARLDAPLDDDTVVDYSLGMQKPDAKYPLPIFHIRKNGNFVLSGNHRVAAAGLVGETTIDAYVVECDDALILDDIVRTANRLHGKRQDANEALRHAYSQMQQFSISAQEAADKFGVSKKRLEGYVRSDKIRVKLQLAGVQAAANFTPAVLLSLGRLNNDTVLREAAKLTHRRSLKLKEVDALVEEIRHAPAEESQQLATVGKQDQKLMIAKREAANEAKQRPLKASFTSKLRSLRSFLKRHNAKDLSKLQVTGVAEKQEVTADIAELQAYLAQLLGGPRVPRAAS